MDIHGREPKKGVAMERRIGESVAAKALARAELARGQALGLARQGLEDANPEMLAKAAAMGWNPSMAGEWFATAMKERSGASIEWLMERFPIDAALSPTMNDPSRDGPGMHNADWSPKAMLAAEEFALGRCSIQQWVGACLRSAGSGEYFEQTLGVNPIWADAIQGRIKATAPAEAIAALCATVVGSGSERSTKARVGFCAAQLGEFLARATREEAEPALRRVAAMAFAHLAERRPLADIEPLLSQLPPWMVAMGQASLKLSRSDRAWQKRQVEAVASELSHPKTARISARLDDPSWEIGAYALMAGQPRDVELALAKGWIGPVDVVVRQKCEHPDFIAYDTAQAEARLGRRIDTTERWLKCEQIVTTARISEAERSKLLDCIDRPDPRAWSEGAPKLLEVERVKKSSPLALMLACVSARRPGDKDVEAKVELLAAAGFRLKDAIAKDDALGADAAANVRQWPWAARIVEREELEEISLAAPARGRKLSL